MIMNCKIGLLTNLKINKIYFKSPITSFVNKIQVILKNYLKLASMSINLKVC